MVGAGLLPEGSPGFVGHRNCTIVHGDDVLGEFRGT
jgi:hypothetical protein